MDPTANVPVEETDDPNLACDPGIRFNGTYVGGDKFDVDAKGQKTTTRIGCFDVEVQGIGTLDPRAKIVRRNLSFSPCAEYAQILDAIEVLENTEYDALFELKRVDKFPVRAWHF